MKTASPVLRLLCVALVAATLGACAVSSENDPAYIKLSKKVALLEQSQEKSQRSLEQFYEELELIVSDINTLKASVRAPSSGASPEMVQAIETAMTRLQALEEGFQKISKDVVVVAEKKEPEKQVAEAPKPEVSKPAPAPEPRPAKPSSPPVKPRRETPAEPASPPSPAESAPPKDNPPNLADALQMPLPPKPLVTVASAGAPAHAAPVSRSRASAPKPPEPQRAQARGRYYEVQIGDTLLGVARAHGVEISDLCKANRMPMSATLYAGQSLYVPAARGGSTQVQ